MARIGIIINPYAKKNVKRKDILRNNLQKIGGDLVDVRITYSLEEVEQAGRDFYNQGVELLGIGGGDGSLCVTLSRLMPIWQDKPFPTIMPLRGGTMNMVCSSAGIKKKPENVLKAVVRSMRRKESLKTIERDTIVIEGRTGFLFGAGMSANFLDAYYEGPGTGPWKAFKIVVHTLLSTIIRGPFSRKIWKKLNAIVRWETDEGRWEEFDYHEMTAILACTIKNLGIGFQPTYRALERPGYLHMLACALGPLLIILRLHKLFFGLPFNHKKMLDVVCRQWQIEGNKPVRYFLDGELYTTEQKVTDVAVGRRLKIISQR